MTDLRSVRAVWLLICLLVLGTTGRPPCRCAHGQQAGRHASAPCADVHGVAEAAALAPAKASCCGSRSSERAPRADGPVSARVSVPSQPAPCAPGHGCCCVDTHVQAAQAPDAPSVNAPLVARWSAAPLSLVDPTALGRPVATRGARAREHSPPLFVVNCTLLC